MSVSLSPSDTQVPESIPMGRLIHDVARLRRTVFDNEMQPAGLTRSQWAVLAALARQEGQAVMQSELAKSMELSKVTLGWLVDRLELKGFVQRMADPTDRRVKRLALTPKGKGAAQAMDGVRPILDDLVMNGLSPLLRAKLSEGLLAMRSNLLRMQRQGSET